MSLFSFFKFSLSKLAAELSEDNQLKIISNIIHNSTKPCSDLNLVKEVEKYLKTINGVHHVQFCDVTLPVLACLSFDFPPSSSIHKQVIRSLKAWISVDNRDCRQGFLVDWIRSNVLKLFRDSFQELNNETACFISIIQSLDLVYDCLRNVFVELPQVYDTKLLLEIAILNSMIEQTVIKVWFESDALKSSETFVKLSCFYHSQYKLLNLILYKFRSIDSCLLIELISNYRYSNAKTAKDILQLYFNSIKYNLIHLKSLPTGILVEASLSLVRLMHLLKAVEYKSIDEELSLEILKSIILDSVTQSPHDRSKFLMLLLSAFLMDSPRSFSLLQWKLQSPSSLSEQLDFRSLINTIVHDWPCKTDSQFVYFTAFLYLNWAKFIHSSLLSNNGTYLEQLKPIHETIKDIIEFAQLYWNYNSIEYIFEATSICIKIMSTITEDRIEFENFLQNDLFECFYKSKSSVSIYRLMSIIYESVSKETFEKAFKTKIISDFTLHKSISHFLLHSNIPTLPSFLDEDCEDVDSGNQQITAVFHSNYRNIDFVRFISIRLNCMFEQNQEDLNQELTNLFKDENSEFFCKFLFKTLLPKLLQIANHTSIVKKMLVHVIDDISALKAEFTLEILCFNRKYNLNIFDNERQFIVRFVKQVALWHFSDDIRLQTLTLMVEHLELDKFYCEEEEDVITKLFVSSCEIQSCSGRNQMTNLFQKLFTKLKTGIQKRSIGMFHYEFVRKIVLFCLDNLSLEKYFGSLIVYLKIISLYLTIFESHNPLKLIESVYSVEIVNSVEPFRISEEQQNSLLLMLEHSFQEIKVLSKEVLVLCFQLNLASSLKAKLVDLETLAYFKLSQIQPQEAQFGVILIRTLFSIKFNSDSLLQLERLVCELKQKLTLMECNIMSSAIQPCYPYICAIRNLICEDLNSLIVLDSNCFLMEIIDTCMRAFDAVREIVCNDSPEGHLPMDYSEKLINMAGDDQENTDEVKKLYITSQMLLLNGWMTVKECVTIISHLASNIVHDYNSDNCKLCQRVLDFLYESQLNLVHRGAFEQCSYAFNRLIASFWKHDCVCCCTKSTAILETISAHLINQTEQKCQFKYQSITRRSAGLPFVVQSILAAECTSLGNISHGGQFVQCMVDILKSNTKKHHWQVVHSLNILKFLVCDTRLSSHMASWIESIFHVAMFWFNRNNHMECLLETDLLYSYSIQNSSSMLFNALIIRVFGVKRNKQDTSRKNRMSSLLFFQSYPSLYSVLMNHFQKALNDNHRKHDHSLYLPLVILSRLTASISNQNIFEVLNYIPLIKRLIMDCSDIRIRTLAVRVYGQLLPVNSYQPNLIELNSQLESIGNCFSVNQNRLHGLGLMLSELLLQYHYATNDFHFTGTDSMFEVLEQLYNTITKLMDSNHLITSTALKVLVLAHLRIYLFLANVCTEIDSLGVIRKLLSSKQNPRLAHQDELNVNLMMDYFMHVLHIPNNQTFIDHVRYLVGLQGSQFTEAKLALWCCLNELMLLTSSTQHQTSNYLLKRSHIIQETVFIGPICEFVFILKKMFNNQLINSNIMILLQSKSFYREVINASTEWISVCRIMAEDNKLSPLPIVHLDIINEIFVLLCNARDIHLIDNIDHFLASCVQNLDPIDCLFKCLQNRHFQCENVHYSTILLLHLCLLDQPITEPNIDLMDQLVSHVMELSDNLENSQSRRTCLTLMDKLIFRWILLYIQNKTIDQDTFCRILLKMHYPLLELLQDNKESIRRCAVRVVQTIAHQLKLEYFSKNWPELQHLPDRSIPMCHKNAIQLSVDLLVRLLQTTSKQMAISYLAKMLLNRAYQYDHNNLSQTDSVLFDKSKLNIYTDEYLLVDLLLKQFNSILANKDNFQFDRKLPLLPQVKQHLEKYF